MEIDGQWYPGELRAWFPQEEGTWLANCFYSTKPGHTYIKTVAAAQVRET